MGSERQFYSLGGAVCLFSVLINAIDPASHFFSSAAGLRVQNVHGGEEGGGGGRNLSRIDPNHQSDQQQAF